MPSSTGTANAHAKGAAPEMIEGEATTGLAVGQERQNTQDVDEDEESGSSSLCGPEGALGHLLGSDASTLELRARHRFEAGVDDFDRVVIHGANRLGSELLVALRRVGLEVKAFVDPVRSKWGRSLAGLQICGLSDLSASSPFSYILAWLPPPLALRRTRLRPNTALLAEIDNSGAGALPWRSAALYLGAVYGPWYEQQGAARILKAAPEIDSVFRRLMSRSSQAAFVRALEQRLTGGSEPPPDSMAALLDPPARGVWPALEYGMPPDTSGIPCVYVDLGAGQGHGLQEFVQRCGPRFAGAFVAERNRAREGRLRELVVELQAEHQADIEMWAGAGQQDDLRRLASLTAGLTHWYERVVRRMGEVKAHLVLDLGGREAAYAQGLQSWIQVARPRICASASVIVESLWELPAALQAAMPDVELELSVDPVDAEVVIVRMNP